MTKVCADLQQAVQCLHEGGVIAYATEAVFGLGCDPQNTQAIDRLLQLKLRSPSKGLILIAAKEDQLYPYLALPKITDEMWQRVHDSWPGPVTWLLPAAPQLSFLLRGEHDTIAVRVSAHPQVRHLCEAFAGVIVSTSANVSQQPPAKTMAEVQAQFGEELDLLLIGQTSGAAKPSEIRDAATGKILRAG